MVNKDYDYIICGAGLAGLSLAIRLADPAFAHLRILIVDKDDKSRNDRTWSFWQLKNEHQFESIFYKTWDRIAFHAPDYSKEFALTPYQYRTIKGLDFYNYAKRVIENCAHITFLLGDVEGVQEFTENVIITISGIDYKTAYAYDSIVKRFPENEKLFVWQHFLGWEVESDEEIFNADTATFMDFRIDQKQEVRFVYILPWESRRALVEATLFSKKITETEVYEEILNDYMNKYFPNKNYKILEKEKGAIPMTSAPFAKGSRRIIPIGTNNGTVKPSSGYAFVRIQEECDQLLDQIRNGIHGPIRRNRRFAAYDKTLLNVILTGKVSGQRAFGDMFRHNEPVEIFKFLDEKTSLVEETKFFKSLPIWPFTRAFAEEMLPFLT